MRWIAMLLVLLTVSCSDAPSAACVDACYRPCRDADEAFQNDPLKNAICAECYRECHRSM